jgi:hypothetical protein
MAVYDIFPYILGAWSHGGKLMAHGIKSFVAGQNALVYHSIVEGVSKLIDSAGSARELGRC